MADAQLDLSLDEIIRRTRETKPGDKPRGSGKPADRPRRGGGAGGKAISFRREQAPRSIRDRTVKAQGGVRVRDSGFRSERLGVRSRGVGKPVARQPAGNYRAPASNPRRANFPPPGPNLEGGGRWQHDLYDDSQPVPSRRQQAGPATGAKLLISNLDFNVTEDDIKELFSTCGPVLRHKLHYDRSGRSEGTAEVIFQNRTDAQKALQKFNNVALDGKKMTIELVAQSANANVVTTLSSGISVTKVGQGGLQGGAARTSSGLQLTRGFQQGLKAALPARNGRGGGMRSDKLRSRVAMDED